MDGSYVVLRFTRFPSENSNDETCVVISKLPDNTFTVGFTEARRATLTTGLTLDDAQELRVYIDTLLAGAMDDDDMHYPIKDFVYEIPGFVSIVAGLEDMYGYSTKYNTFCQAIELWLASSE